MSVVGAVGARGSCSASGVRKLRYRALLDNLATIDKETNSNAETVAEISSIVSKTDQILSEGNIEERARHPGEGYLDSQVLRATSNLVIRCSNAISGNVNTYDKNALAAHIHENPNFWDFMLPRQIAPLAYLHGTFDPTPPAERPRKQRRRVERQQMAELREPEAVDRLEKTEEGSEMVSRVYKFIIKKYKKEGNQPLSYFHLVLDPDSFGRTIENIYHLSFLARDGLVSIDIDESVGLPFVTPVSSAQQENDQLDKDDNQFIVSMDMARWRQMVEAFGVREPMMAIKRHSK